MSCCFWVSPSSYFLFTSLGTPARGRNSIGTRWGNRCSTRILRYCSFRLSRSMGAMRFARCRWMQFSRTLGKSNFWNVLSATIMGFSCSFLLGRPAEPIRPILIAKKDSLPVAGMFGVYFLERISDIAATVVLAGVALYLFDGHGLINERNAHLMAFARSTGRVLLIGLLVVIAFLVFFRFYGGHFLASKLREFNWKTGWREKVVALVEGFSEGLQGIRTWNDLFMLVLYTALHWILVAFIYLWIAHAFGGNLATLTFSSALLVLAFTMVGSVAQLPGVGGGAQATSILVFTLIFGVEQEAAVTVSIVLWLITFASCCLVGLPLLFREGWSMGDLRRMVKEQERASEAACWRMPNASQFMHVTFESEASLKCPFCAHLDDKVVDSREARTGDLIRRRRECLKCSRRFTTYERIDEIPYMVIKKDGRREKFDRQKILQGLLKACEKRPVPVGKLETIVDEAEAFVSEAPERERTTTEIGELLMNRLKKLDKVAYVRFASVYLDFKDVKEFMDELKGLLKDRAKK